MARVPKILIVDQDPKARFEVKQLVKQAHLTMAGEAGLGTEAVSLASDAQPDVIICGISKPADRSLQTIEALLDVLPETPIIAYGWQDDAETVRQAMRAGARDFFAIPVDVDRLIESVRAVLESEERKQLRLSGQTKALGPRGLTIAVFGAKGGVGKTTLATNLGVCFSRSLGQSVALVDADNSFGDVAAMLDIKSEKSIVDLTQNVDTVERTGVADYLAHHESGLQVLPAPRETLTWRSVAPDKFRRTVNLLSRQFDIVLIDTAPMLTDLSLAVMEEANMVLWVTSSDFSSINNSLIGLETLQQLSYPESRIRLVLNVNSSDDGVRPSKIEAVLGREFFWHVPYDRHVRTGAQVGRPVVISNPDCAGARSLSELAQSLMGTGSKAVLRQPSLRSRLFSRRNGHEKIDQVNDPSGQETMSAVTSEGRP